MRTDDCANDCHADPAAFVVVKSVITEDIAIRLERTFSILERGGTAARGITRTVELETPISVEISGLGHKTRRQRDRVVVKSCERGEHLRQHLSVEPRIHQSRLFHQNLLTERLSQHEDVGKVTCLSATKEREEFAPCEVERRESGIG